MIFLLQSFTFPLDDLYVIVRIIEQKVLCFISPSANAMNIHGLSYSHQTDVIFSMIVVNHQAFYQNWTTFSVVHVCCRLWSMNQFKNKIHWNSPPKIPKKTDTIQPCEYDFCFLFCTFQKHSCIKLQQKKNTRIIFIGNFLCGKFNLCSQRNKRTAATIKNCDNIHRL